MALRKHLKQSDTVRSGVHCPRVYSFCELVNSSSSVANFLPVSEFEALVAKEFIAFANKSLNRSFCDSVMFCVLVKNTPGTSLMVAKMDWLE